jgi:hypothetical protein
MFVFVSVVLRPPPPPPPPPPHTHTQGPSLVRPPMSVSKPLAIPLACVLSGVHLPAGRAEVQEIERMRQRRAFEEALPPMTDEASFIVRRRLMEVQVSSCFLFPLLMCSASYPPRIPTHTSAHAHD